MRRRALVFIVIVITAIVVITGLIVSKLPKRDDEEIREFQKYKSNFEMMNNYFLEIYGNSHENNKVFLDKKISQIVGLNDGNKVQISKELKASLNSIVPAFENYDFSFIDVNDERIAYCGEGYRMYVYSRNGKSPTYFYHRGDGMHPEVYELYDNWYLLKANFR